MTDEDREIAIIASARLLDQATAEGKFDGNRVSARGRFVDGVIQGYAAACDAKRATVAQQQEIIVGYGSLIDGLKQVKNIKINGLKLSLVAERARSAKLIEALKEIAKPWLTESQIKASGGEYYLTDEAIARDAISEYEASK